jgi:ribosomal protein S27E
MGWVGTRRKCRECGEWFKTAQPERNLCRSCGEPLRKPLGGNANYAPNDLEEMRGDSALRMLEDNAL